MQYRNKIISYLLSVGKSVSVDEIAKYVDINGEKILSVLESSFEEEPYEILRSKNRYSIVSKDTLMNRKKVSDELSSALLQTLVVVAYCSPVSKTTIDAIRGVNSRHALQTMLQLRYINEDNQGYFLTVEGKAFLSIKKTDDLPDYRETRQQLLEGLSEQSMLM
jgi:chromosome segregation and condensation protein ScpB